MSKKNTLKTADQEPTKSELEILQFLWQYGPSTTRQVNDYLNANIRPVIYMSTLKLMQIMVEKGMLKKDQSKMSHVYCAAVEEGRTKGALLDRVVETIFNGSASSLVMQLLGNRKLSAKEMEEYQDLIKRIDENQE